MFRLTNLAGLALLVLCLLCQSVQSEIVPRGSFGRMSLGGRFSDSSQEGVLDAVVPLWRTDDSVLFTNVRGSFLEDREQQVSGGLILRHLLEDQGLILGLNTYWDRRWTETHNQFNQVGAGIEVLSKWIDLRANYYYPLTDAKVLGAKQVLVPGSHSGGGLRMVDYQDFEEALQGYDAEIGVWLPYLSKWVPTALYAGYYDFSSDYRRNLNGVRLRTEIQIHPNLTLDGEWYENRDLNRVDHSVGLRVHLPLDFWNGWRFDQGRASGGRMANRMLDMVNRDFGIRTIQTGFVPVATSLVSPVANNQPAPSPTSSEPPPAAEAPPPICFLDSEGEVVCE